MAFRVFNGSTWSTQKGIRVYNGSSWSAAVRGWVYNGSSWSIAYPEFPLNTSSPTLSGDAYYQGTLYASVGGWNSDLAYSPSSYTYQWLRNGSSISGATGSSYVSTSADVGQSISCLIGATNNRGTTYAQSNSVTVLPIVSSVAVSDATYTPSTPTGLSVSGGVNTWSATWSAATFATTYSVSATTGSISYSYGSTSASATSATPGSVTVYVSSVNTTGRLTASWSAAVGATSYDIYRNGSYVTNTTGTSYSFENQTTGSSVTVTVYPKYNSTQGYGASGSGTPQNKSSSSASASGTVQAPVYAPTYITYSASSSRSYLHTNATLYTQTGESLSLSSVSSDGTSPVTYTYNWGYTSTSGGAISGGWGTSSSFTVPSTWNGYEVACIITATNTAGSTSTTTTRWSPIVAPNITPQSPSGVIGYNDNSPTGGTFYWDQANSVNNVPGVGSSIWNYLSGPTWGWSWERYRSTTSGGTYTLHNSGVKSYTDTRSVATSTTGWYYFRIQAYAANGITSSAWVRYPSSGGIQFT